jgi:hypothetical protein
MEEYYIQDISEKLSTDQFTCLEDMFKEYLSQQLMEELKNEINT